MPTHAYGAAGTYAVLLWVTDEDGGMETGTLTMTVTPPAVFLPFVIC